MSCLVKSRRPNGTVYVYRSTSVWDSEKGYPVPKRTLVGKLGPSGEIIPTRKQNRQKGSTDTQEHAAGDAVPGETAQPGAQTPEHRRSAQDMPEVWREYQETIDRLQRELDEERRENARMRRLIQSMRKLLDASGNIGGEPEA